MTDRELMQMALDALEKISMGGDPRWADDVMPALRARLAQPEPDDGYCQACDGNNCTAKDGCVARDNPPPQREWQGLTDKDIENCLEMSIHGTCRAIEAKLKEKNA